jgi:proteasome-associated ATPase
MSESSTSTPRPGLSDDGGHWQGRGDRSAEEAHAQHDFIVRLDILQTLLAGSAETGDEPSQLLNELRADALEIIGRNQRLAESLQEARDQIGQLQGETAQLQGQIEQLSRRESPYGIFLQKLAEGTVDVFLAGKKVRANVSPSIDVNELRPGQQVLLDEELNVVQVTENDPLGEVVRLQDVLAGGDRVRVLDSAGREHVVKLAEHLRNSTLRLGDSFLLEKNSIYVIERIAAEADDFLVEETPDIDYDRIGGLAEQIQQIREAVELPYLHSDLFERFRLRPPNGILLYGPPGCGKTMLAKAVAKSMAQQVTVRTGKLGSGHFLSIKVTKLLDKYIGETEKHIRLVFRRARELAAEGMPVIVFLDDMDALFRIRQSGGSGIEDTIVPQLISEIDGVVGLRNLIVIGATNRKDVIDPSFLRPGRIDLQIKVARPNAEQAAQILAKFLTADIPIHRADLSAHSGNARAAIAEMIRRTIEYLYTEDERTQLFEVTYSNGDKEVLYLSDFNSGVTLHDIVDRAKSAASKRYLESRNWGLSIKDLFHAADETITNIQDFTTEMARDDIARISGRKGERIAYTRMFTRYGNRSIELERTVSQYSSY